MPNQATAPEAEAPKQKARKPAKIKGMHRASGPELEHGVRDIKLLRPVCHICAPEVEKAGWGWWARCPHDPYVGERGEKIEDPSYEDEIENGEVVGRVLVGKTEKTILRPYPNFVGVAQSRRLNSNQGPYYKIELYGFIHPEDLKGSKAFPDGVAPCCEFINCFWQDDLVEYASGTFCSELEAILVYENERGTTQERNNQDIRADQFAISRAKLLGSTK